MDEGLLVHILHASWNLSAGPMLIFMRKLEAMKTNHSFCVVVPEQDSKISQYLT